MNSDFQRNAGGREKFENPMGVRLSVPELNAWKPSEHPTSPIRLQGLDGGPINDCHAGLSYTSVMRSGFLGRVNSWSNISRKPGIRRNACTRLCNGK